MRYLYIILILFALTVSCKRSNEISKSEYEKIYEAKGLNMNESLKPIILECKYSFDGVKEYGENTLVTVNDNGEYCTLEIDDNGYVEMKKLSPGFPKDMTVRQTIPEHKIVMSWLARYACIYDGELNEKREVGASNKSNAEITDIMLIDPEKKIYLITLTDHAKEIGEPGAFYIVYDFINDITTYMSDYFEAMFYYFANNKLLAVYFNGQIGKYYIIDQFMKTREENKLTKSLTKFNIFFYSNDCIRFNKRFGLGTAWIKDDLIYYSVRWDEKYEEVKIEPIIIQKPYNLDISSRFLLSQDGNWVKTTVDNVPGPVDASMLVLYNVSDIYPQGLSMPIMAGYSSSDSGCFMNHKTWGPCYVDYDLDHPKKLFIFKLNDGLKILAKQAANFIEKK